MVFLSLWKPYHNFSLHLYIVFSLCAWVQVSLYIRGVLLLGERHNSTHNTPTSSTSSKPLHLPKWNLTPPQESPPKLLHALHLTPHYRPLRLRRTAVVFLQPPTAISKPLFLLPALKIPGYEVSMHISQSKCPKDSPPIRKVRRIQISQSLGFLLVPTLSGNYLVMKHVCVPLCYLL